MARSGFSSVKVHESYGDVKAWDVLPDGTHFPIPVDKCTWNEKGELVSRALELSDKETE